MSVAVTPNVTIAVEMAFGYDFRSVSPAWTDISAYVRHLRIDQGRHTELDRIEAATLTMELDNADRRFEPEYTSGAYSPDVKVGVPVRVKATHNAVEYDRFYGFVEAWAQSYPEVLDAVVTVTATDFFAWLAGQKWETYRRVVLEDQPVAYWRLDEPAGSRVADSSQDGTYAGKAKGTGWTKGASGPLNGSAFEGGAASNRIDFGQNIGLHLDDDLTVEFWVYDMASPSVNAPFVMCIEDGQDQSSTTGPDNAAFLVAANGTFTTDDIAIYWGNGTDSVGFVTTSAVFSGSNTWKHVAITRSMTPQKVRMYVDGAEVAAERAPNDGVYMPLIVSGGGAPTWVTPATTDTYRTLIGGNDDGTDAIDNYRLAHVALYDRALTATEIEAHANADQDTFAEHTTDVRIGLILDEADWPAGARNLDTGNVTLPAIAIGNETLIDQLRQVETAEQGLLYQGPDGVIEFRDGHTRLTQTTTSAATYGTGAGELEYTNLAFDYDRRLVFNDVRVESRDRGPIVATDTTSQNTYGIRTLPIDGALLLDANRALNLAQAYIHRFKDPHWRPTEMTILPEGDEANQYPEVLGNGIGTRITLNHQPPGGGTDIAGDFFIEHISDEVWPQVWRTTYALSPVDDVWEFWIVADATYGVLGSTTIAGY